MPFLAHSLHRTTQPWVPLGALYKQGETGGGASQGQAFDETVEFKKLRTHSVSHSGLSQPIIYTAPSNKRMIKQYEIKTVSSENSHHRMTLDYNNNSAAHWDPQASQ